MKKFLKQILFTVGIFALIGTIFLISSKNTKKLTYKMIDTPASEGIKQMKNIPDGMPITVVLRRTGCIYCDKDKDKIIPNVEISRLKGEKVIVFNLKQMNKSQINFLKHNFPKILYHKKYLATPTVFIAVKNHHKWKVTTVENTGNLKNIQKILQS